MYEYIKCISMCDNFICKIKKCETHTDLKKTRTVWKARHAVFLLFILYLTLINASKYICLYEIQKTTEKRKLTTLIFCK